MYLSEGTVKALKRVAELLKNAVTASKKAKVLLKRPYLKYTIIALVIGVLYIPIKDPVAVSQEVHRKSCKWSRFTLISHSVPCNMPEAHGSCLIPARPIYTTLGDVLFKSLFKE